MRKIKRAALVAVASLALTLAGAIATGPASATPDTPVTGTPAPAPGKGVTKTFPPGKCSAYTLNGGVSACAVFSGWGDVNCADVRPEHKPVKVNVKGQDPWSLDKDGDGRACESETPATTKPTVTRKPTPRPSQTTVPATAGGGQLPLTGPGVYAVGAVGALLVLAGGVGIVLARRRRVTFSA